MKDNQCVEVLPNGKIHYYDLDVCNKEAEKSLDELYAKEDTVPNFDAVAAMYAVFVESLYVLHYTGLSTEDLIHEVIKHTAELNGGFPEKEDYDE